MASHFVLDIFWTCDLSIYIYIYRHVDALFMVLYVSLFMMMRMKFLYDVFLHVYACLYVMMHDIVFCMFPMCDDEHANFECH